MSPTAKATPVTGTTRTVISRDGTPIAYEKLGAGPVLILVGGALDHRNSPSTGLPLAALLAESLTVYAYDRRGRGDSGDTAPYAVAREVEDLAAIIGAAGGSAMVYGLSSGAALALEAAASGLPISKLALYEPPFSRGPDMADQAKAYLPKLSALLAEDRRGDALALFMTRVGLPEPMIAGARNSPFWPQLEALAPTLAYDSEVMRDPRGGIVPTERITSITAPTRVIVGGASPEWMRKTGRDVADALPNGSYEVLPDQTHDVDIAALAPVISKFLVD